MQGEEGKSVMADTKKQIVIGDMQYKKNQELEIIIEDMGNEGEGIGKVCGYTFFVKDAVTGDRIKAKITKLKKNYGYARLIQIIEPSRWRIEPVCPVARQCGGCQIQHLSYDMQLEWKRKKVEDCIRRIGGFKDIEVENVIGMNEPYYYRNKAQFPIGYDKNGKLVAGFYAGRTHNIIPFTECCIQHKCSSVILDVILKFMNEYNISAYDEVKHSGLVRHVIIRVGKATSEVMACIVVNGKKFKHGTRLVDMLLNTDMGGVIIKSICVNYNTEKTNVILGDKIDVLYGTPYITDCIGEIEYRISPLSFYQVNPVQTEKLYKLVLEMADLKGDDVVWDMYCGIGTVSLFLAKQAKMVYGVEIVPNAVKDARINAKINKIENVEFFEGAAEDVVSSKYKKSGGRLRADVVILDPPRKGCDEKLLDTVVNMQAGKIVYVSCDPATLARDLKYFGDRGYEVERVKPCDMFGQSYHVECVVLMSRVEK